jgi:hypothetical protein
MKLSTILTVAFASAASAIHYGIYSVSEKGWLVQNSNNNFLIFDSETDRPMKWTMLFQNNDGVIFQSVATDEYINCNAPWVCERSKDSAVFELKVAKEDESGDHWNDTLAIREIERDCVWTIYAHAMRCEIVYNTNPEDETPVYSEKQQFKIMEI